MQIHGGGTSGNPVHCFSGVDSDTCGDGVGDTSPGPDGLDDAYDDGD